MLAVAFMGSGAVKLSGNEGQMEFFRKWGYPIFSMYVIGGLEVLGVIGLFIRKLRKWAALGLAGLMIGAVGSHLLFDAPMTAGPAFVLLLVGLGYDSVSVAAQFVPSGTGVYVLATAAFAVIAVAGCAVPLLLALRVDAIEAIRIE